LYVVQGKKAKGVIIVLALLVACAVGADYAAVIPTGPAGTSYAATEPSFLESKPAGFLELRPAILDRADSEVMVVVAGGLETALEPELSQFTQDLENEGYSVSVQVMTGGSPADLRSMLQSHSGLGGAILVGALPAAWYEMDEWSGQYEEFPLDLYYADLDGSWADADGDGLFDSHTGDIQAEIWIGRIDAHAMEFGNELDMLRDYFEKNHLYRTGALAVPGRALVFNDDDWAMSGECGLGSIYSDLTLVEDAAQTSASYYRDRLAYGYEFVHLMSHSSPWGHTFKGPSGYLGTVMAPEISEIDPQTVFVQLFACSNCRWTEPNCLGNWYLFGEDYCLLAIGSTKTGSMLSFEEFYGPIGSGTIPGVSFRDWFNGVGIYDPAWHYGCVLLGDPTIVPLSSVAFGASIPGATSPSRAYVEVSTSPYSDCFPAAAAAGDDVWIAWMTGGTARLDIAARRFDGESWSQVYVVDQDEYWDVQPSLALDGSGNPWLAWASFEESNYGYIVRLATGPAFGTLSTAVQGTGYDVDPKLAWASGRMWLAWQTWRRGGGDIMVKSLDGAFPETYISADGADDFSPTASVDPAGSLHVAWVEDTPSGDRILECTGGSGGFGPPSEASSGDFCRAPALGTAQNQLFLAWQEDDDGAAIKVRRWNGSAWEVEQTLYSSATITACMPAIGESPTGAPVVAWQQGRGAGAQIWACTLTGSGWTEPAQLVNPTGPAWAPALCDGGIAWAGTNGTADWDIYVSLDGGLGAEDGPGSSTGAIRLSSNPVCGSASLDIPSSVSEIGFAIYDIAGRTVDSGRMQVAGGTAEIPCASLPTGAYVLVVDAGAGARTLRMTVLR
jgi:hypothetical protein